MMKGQARRSGLVMGFDTHMIAGAVPAFVQRGPRSPTSPTGQTRTMTRPCPVTHRRSAAPSNAPLESVPGTRDQLDRSRYPLEAICSLLGDGLGASSPER